MITKKFLNLIVLDFSVQFLRKKNRFKRLHRLIHQQLLGCLLKGKTLLGMGLV